jgi:hypothetical protein
MSTRPRSSRTTAPVADVSLAADDPWALVWGQPYIDVDRLVKALENDLQATSAPDYRTRLLVRDSARAIKSFWGAPKFQVWLSTSPVGERIREILQENIGRPGFRYIRRRLVPNVSRADIEQALEILGRQIHERVEVNIARSVPTLIAGLTARPTDDIDVVNEVPAQIRRQRRVLQKIKSEYGLAFGHVRSHYLPTGWENRRQFLGDFGGIRAYLVDAIDIFVSKLSSKQDKHQQDLRVMAKALDKDWIRERLFTAGKAFVEDPRMCRQIEKNWKFIFREPLISDHL